jgi:polyisoprenoid-binding protein YceI
MPISVGTHKLGPENATLSVRTKKAGAASKAGHDLLIEVTSWSATLDVGADPGQTSIELTADSTSMKVIEGTGGVMALGDSDKVGIAQTINDEVLTGTRIEFHSSAVQAAGDGDHLHVSGELDLAGKRLPLSFELTVGVDGRLTGSAIVKQSDWGIKPYSALFGTLKVIDEVTVEIAAKVPSG